MIHVIPWLQELLPFVRINISVLWLSENTVDSEIFAMVL